MSVKNIAVLVSGGGTNLQALLDACESGEINGRIGLVLSSNSKAYALERAHNHGVPAIALPRALFPSIDACDRARHEVLARERPDLIVLAGYLGILLPETVAMFRGRILNTHPALIPAFCGRGMYGRHVHEAVVNSGVKLSGCTVHLVEEGVDTGPILLQQSVPVYPDDDAAAVAARIAPIEHRLLVRAVAAAADGRIRTRAGKAWIVEDQQ